MRITKAAVEAALKSKLKLKEPQFRLEKWGSLISGSVISTTFKGKGDWRRQIMISDALETAFGDIGAKRVGMILAYTPFEWDPFAPPVRTKEKATAGK
ncbi:MAG TPA: hypothetical protein VFC46_11805 [Humisphaera sp.]|nr:hypothetical protein [Humisphaera sp.]